jgi:hypothetical protein
LILFFLLIKNLNSGSRILQQLSEPWISYLLDCFNPEIPKTMNFILSSFVQSTQDNAFVCSILSQRKFLSELPDLDNQHFIESISLIIVNLIHSQMIDDLQLKNVWKIISKRSKFFNHLSRNINIEQNLIEILVELILFDSSTN